MRNKGFSRIEVLTAVLILAILIAILYPAFARIRMASQPVACASNLHRMGVTLVSCVQTDKNYPGHHYVAAHPAFNISPVIVRPTRLRLMTPGDQSVFWCPASGPEFQWRDTRPIDPVLIERKFLFFQAEDFSETAADFFCIASAVFSCG